MADIHNPHMMSNPHSGVHTEGKEMTGMERSVDNTFVGGGSPYAGGYGMGFGGSGFGAGFVGGIFGSALFGRRGFGSDGCCDDGHHANGFANWSKLESIENQITNQSITEQFNAGIINTNAGFRDVAIGQLGLSREMCEHSSKSDLQFALTNKNIDDSKCEILNAMKDTEIQNLRDKVFLQSQNAQTTAIEGMFTARGLFEGSGPVITAHAPAVNHDRDFMLMAMFQNQQAANFALNTGTNVNTGFQGQGLGQGAGALGVQK